jgi:hypothetical protein
LDLDLTDLAGYRELDVHGLRTRWAR